MTLTELQNRAYQTAKDKGFLDIKPKRTIGDQLMLSVGELSEALEEIRNGKRPDEIYYSGDGKPEGFPIEVADCIIRLAQLAEECQFNLNGACKEKMDYNDGREFLHGNKKL